MVTFDAAQPGTSEREWVADARLHDRPILDVGTIKEAVIIAAHPDDETLGAGGFIARCHALGVRVRIVCVTDGAAADSELTGRPAAGLAQERAAELAAAVSDLAPTAELVMLGFPDGGTREHRAEIIEALSATLAEVSRDAILFAPWRGDGHRDHRVVGEIAIEVAQGRTVLEYPVWMWHWASPDHPDTPWESMIGFQVDAAVKSRALEHFHSQISGDQPMLRPDFLEHFTREQEFFILADHSIGQSYFDRMYAKSEDPWRFRTRWYEERKRQITLAALPHERYQRALEIGCSIGVLTDLLAARCEQLLAVDISPAAVEQAQRLLGSRATVRTQDALADFPSGEFDLVVLSEVGYYWGATGLERALDSIRTSLTPHGVLIACHWRHPVSDYPLTGDEVHAALARQEWHRVVSHIEADFILDVYSNDPRSVAQREGLA